MESGLQGLLTRFDNGLETQVIMGGDSISLGQKQLIAFMRAVLRKPELLILDEATANIDTDHGTIAGRDPEKTAFVHYTCGDCTPTEYH